MRKFLAAAAAFSLAAAPSAAQPPQGNEATEARNDEDGGLEGEKWAYLALPAIIVVILLIALLGGEDEGAISP